MNKSAKYIIDSRYFNGNYFTHMKDGVHCDVGGETLEELRIKENNPFLVAVPLSRTKKILCIYHQGLMGTFNEITEQEYYDLMNLLPPIRLESLSFFVGEPYCTNIYPFCFMRNDRYFTGLRSIKTPQDELDRQIEKHMEIINRKAAILKDTPTSQAESNTDNLKLISYYFSPDGKQALFIGNLITGTDNKTARKDMAETLKSLRKNHYMFYKGKGIYETPDNLISHIENKGFTLVSNGNFFQYPQNRESATFIGQIKETGEEFIFRIYDREYFLHILKRLRAVKKESKYGNVKIKA